MTTHILLSLALSLTPAEPVAQYTQCIEAISVNPETAYEDALAWRHQGGGWPAEHCVSLALIALGHEEPGALRLREAAETATASPASRAIMFGQSGDGFLQAGAYEEAITSFQAGLVLDREDAGLHTGLAQARLALNDYERAEASASAALALVPSLWPARQIRAEARLYNNNLSGAQRDIEAALNQDPENIDLLLLRGKIIQARHTH